MGSFIITSVISLDDVWEWQRLTNDGWMMGSFTITSTISLYDWWYGGMLVSWVVVESDR